MLSVHFADYIFCCAEVFKFSKVHLSIFIFVAFAFEVLVMNSLPRRRSERVFPGFSSGNFIVSGGLTFKSLIQPELFLKCGERQGSRFILLHMAVQFSQNHLLNRLSFPQCMFLSTVSKISWF